MDAGELDSMHEWTQRLGAERRSTSAHSNSERRHALGQLYASCARVVFGYVWRRTGDRHLAEDLASEAFVRAYERLDDLRPTAASRAWLLRVASNLVNRWARKQQLLRWLSLSSEDAPELVEPANDDQAHVQLESELRRALLQMPVRDQTLLALHYVEGLDLNTVARVVGCPLGTVHSRLSRARARLRARLEERKRS